MCRTGRKKVARIEVDMTSQSIEMCLHITKKIHLIKKMNVYAARNLDLQRNHLR